MGNAIKHAYPSGEECSVFVSLREEEEQITLREEDEGRGPPEGLKPRQSESIGFTLEKRW